MTASSVPESSRLRRVAPCGVDGSRLDTEQRRRDVSAETLEPVRSGRNRGPAPGAAASQTGGIESEARNQHGLASGGVRSSPARTGALNTGPESACLSAGPEVSVNGNHAQWRCALPARPCITGRSTGPGWRHLSATGAQPEHSAPPPLGVAPAQAGHLYR